jgi:hypothetical protein
VSGIEYMSGDVDITYVENPVDNVHNPSDSKEYFLWGIICRPLCNIQKLNKHGSPRLTCPF